MPAGRAVASTVWIVLLLLLGSGCAGETTSSEAAQSAESDVPEAVYIPANLDECFVELNKLLTPEDIAYLRDGTEYDMSRQHLGLGMWLRNNWGLWSGSRLTSWFNERGIFHPDDMSAIILSTYWRHLNGQPLALDEQIENRRAH